MKESKNFDKKLRLLNELSFNTYSRISPSTIDGVGIFAIRDIPKGCINIFSDNSMPQEEWLEIPRAEIDALPIHAKELVERYCLFDVNTYFVPEYGFKKVDLVIFINHSDEPNLKSLNDGEYFEALRDIKNGEELFLDYGDIVDEE